MDINSHTHANLDTDLILFTKINSRRIMGLNVKCKTIKLLENSIEENLGDLRFGGDFLGAAREAQSMKEKNNKLDYIRIKNFCSANDIVNK